MHFFFFLERTVPLVFLKGTMFLVKQPTSIKFGLFSERRIVFLVFWKGMNVFVVKQPTSTKFGPFIFLERRIVPLAFRKGMNVFGVKQAKHASHSTTTALTSFMANVRIGWTLRESRFITVWTAPPCQTVLPVWRDLAVGGVETPTIPKSGSVWAVGFLVSAHWLS